MSDRKGKPLSLMESSGGFYRNNSNSVARKIITSLDVGTSTVQTVVAEIAKDGSLRILGLGIAPSSGVRRGVVVDLDEVTSSIRKSVEEAEKGSGVPVRSVWLGIGGTHISVASSRGVVAVSRADGEISPEDEKRVIAAAETFVSKNPNKEVLHVIPRDFKVDHQGGIKDPKGMHGVRLEVETLVIECLAPFLKNLFKSVEHAGLRVEDYVFSPLAAAEAVLTKRQKELGAMVLDIGGGTASFMVFEEGTPVHAGIIPIGGNHITNDVAIGFKTNIDVAEQIKVAYGSCLPGELPKRDTVRLAEFIPDDPSAFSRRELAEIVEARLCDIFELIQKELKKIERNELLPAGIILTGGSTLLPGVVDLAKRELRLPVEIGIPKLLAGLDERTAPALASALGILHWGAGLGISDSDPTWKRRVSNLGQNTWLKWMKSLLP